MAGRSPAIVGGASRGSGDELDRFAELAAGFEGGVGDFDLVEGIGAADDAQQYPIAGLAVGRQVAGKEEHSLAGAPRM